MVSIWIGGPAVPHAATGYRMMRTSVVRSGWAGSADPVQHRSGRDAPKNCQLVGKLGPARGFRMRAEK
jgi:hypothetical protein